MLDISDFCFDACKAVEPVPLVENPNRSRTYLFPKHINRAGHTNDDLANIDGIVTANGLKELASIKTTYIAKRAYGVHATNNKT